MQFAQGKTAEERQSGWKHSTPLKKKMLFSKTHTRTHDGLSVLFFKPNQRLKFYWQPNTELHAKAFMCCNIHIFCVSCKWLIEIQQKKRSHNSDHRYKIQHKSNQQPTIVNSYSSSAQTPNVCKTKTVFLFSSKFIQKKNNTNTKSHTHKNIL